MEKSSTITLTWDVIMTKQHCCGVDSYKDFDHSKFRDLNYGIVPQSCCSSDHENEKTYTMDTENDAIVTVNPQENVLNGSKRSTSLSPSLLSNMFLEKYSDVKTRRHNQPR